MLDPVLAPPWTLSQTIKSTIPFCVGIVLEQAGAHMKSTTHLSPKAQMWATAAGLAITAAMLLIPVYWIAIRREQPAWRELGFRKPSSPNVVGTVLLAVLSYFAWLIALSPILKHLARGHVDFGTGRPAYLIAMIGGAIMAPVVEETFFRGFLFAGLRPLYPFWIVAGATGILFGLGHAPILPQIGFGVIMSTLREKTNSLWPCIAAHASVNGILFSAVYFATGKISQ